MARKQDTEQDPAAGPKSPRAGKRPKDIRGAPPAAEDAGETDGETQARESESAFDRALGRIPPG